MGGKIEGQMVSKEREEESQRRKRRERVRK
jgi:hypothetical protein